jgi:hypothetical protein
MEEPEVPTEHLHAHLEEGAEAGPRWVMGVALTAALLAGLAAVASMHAGYYANEAMISQIESSDKWSFYQAKSIKESQLNSKMELLEALGKTPSEADRKKVGEYEKDKADIQKEAEDLGREARHFLHVHHFTATSVTMFQIAIALGAISVLTRRKLFWFVCLGFGVAGLYYMLLAWRAIQGA